LRVAIAAGKFQGVINSAIPIGAWPTSIRLAPPGAIAKGRMANLVVTDGDLLGAKTKVKYVFVEGRRDTQQHDVRGPGLQPCEVTMQRKNISSGVKWGTDRRLFPRGAQSATTSRRRDDGDGGRRTIVGAAPAVPAIA
jgi:hypothetical protein